MIERFHNFIAKFIFGWILFWIFWTYAIASGSPENELFAWVIETWGSHDLNIVWWVLMSIIMLWVIALIATEKVQRTLVVFFVATWLIFTTYTLLYPYTT